MRLLFIPFILLSLVCFGQKSTDYIIDIKYGSNDQLQTSRTTYLTLTKNNSSSKKEFPYEAIVNGIVYKEPQRSYHFSSIHPDSNQNITSSSVLIDILYLLNRPIRFDIRNNEILLDTNAIQADITDQLNQWELKEDISTNASGSCFVQAKSIISQLYLSGMDKTTRKEILSEPKQIQSNLYTLTKKDKNHFYFTFKDTSSSVINEGKSKVDKKTLFVLESTHLYEDTGHNFKSTTDIQISNIPIQSSVTQEYADMLILHSFLSNALQTNNEMDSSKVMAFIDKYNPIYNDDQIFVQNKLSLLQRIKNQTGYDDELNDSRIELLAGTHHMSNLLYRDDDMPLDKFAAIVPLLDDAQRYDWLQNSFYQNLNRDSESYQEKLDLLVNNFSEEIRQSAYPMALWYKIKENNTEDKKEAIHELMQLDMDYWGNGNAGRYALFLYKDMKEYDPIYSAQLLDDIITKLTFLYEQTSESTKKISQVLLATSHYWAYEATKADNINGALAHLEKASSYSPKNERDLAYSSHYDISFLKAKKSYSEDYLTVLANSGGLEIALQKYIDEFLTAQASSYEGLRIFYEKNYPEKSFSTFFKDTVLPQLEDAPDFTLTNIQNETKTLENLKGKWTLVDFWGTWCGPCVAEMPKLNQFHEQLKEDEVRSDKINFITIACHDTEEKVKSFLAKNDYGIPVLMSDGEVQKSYEVKGYPSKYIISPQGKLIAIPFGFNWQPILEDLAKL